MPTPRSLVAVALLTACHSYEPAPVDLAAHARAFAERLQHGPADAPPERGDATFDLDDGIDAAEARQLALMFHPDCRAARARAGVARVTANEAGRLPDPRVGFDAERILETVPHRWLIRAATAFTIPLSGRLSAARDLADANHATAVATALVVERDVAASTDLAFARWSAATRRADLLGGLVDRLRQLEAIAGRLAEADEITDAAARAFTLERVQRDAEAARERTNVAALVLELKRLTGLHPDAQIPFVPSPAPTPAIADPAQRRERLFAAPRLLALRAQHDAAERSLALAVRQQWPDFEFAPGFAEEDAQPRATLGLAIPLPIFSGNTPAIRTAEAERERAAEALRAGYETLVQDLAAAELRVDAAQQQLAFVERELVPLVDRQVEDCRRLAELGQLDPLLILDALVRDHGARILATAARLELDEATIARDALFASEPTAPETSR